MELSGITIRPPFGSRACAAMTDCSSDLSRTGEGIASTAKEVAAVLKGFSQNSAYVAVAGLNSIAIRATRNLLEQFHPFAGHRRLGRKHETGDVAARVRQARDEAAANRVGNERENDGDGARLLKQRRCGGRGARKKDIRR